MAAGSTTSSLTTTSQTLSFAPGIAAQMPTQNALADASTLLDTLTRARRHAFLQPPPSIPAASLQVVKDTLDAFAGQISDQQLQRLKQATKDKNKKRKRTDGTLEVLKIRKVHLDGFETGQVWQQARRIIQSALSHSEEALRELEEKNEIVVDEDDAGESSAEDALFGEEEEEEEEDDSEEEDEDDSMAEDDTDEDLNGDLVDDGLEGQLDEDGLQDDEEEEGSGESREEEEEEGITPGHFVEDPNGLNDGFFSIDDFNKQTQWFEDQDARGDPYTDDVSDEDEINWNTDPLASSGEPSKTSRSKANDIEQGDDDQAHKMHQDEEEEDDDDDEEDGPTFGNMDLNAPEGFSEDEENEAEGEEEAEFNANDIFYKDFFAPPRKPAKDKSHAKKSVRFGPKPITEEDVERAMNTARRDLFEDEDDDLGGEGDSDDDALSDVSAGDPRSRRSAHERRQAKLAEEIRRLEAASVAKREWTLAGEASAAERPVDSLLDQQLDFEHVGKPVPVITTEVNESIEDLIKRRVLANEFDELIRRRPDAAALSGSRRGLVDFELEDTKSGKGLAEIYEEEYKKKTDPEGYVSKSDEKLRAEEAEVEKMWKELSSTLDALSSWNYRPRPTEAQLSVVADAPTIAMEDAQPATAQGVAGGESMLAPQEVYKAGAGASSSSSSAAKGEIVPKSGLPVARGEMTREEKQRRRRREKERIRKAGGTSTTTASGSGSASASGSGKKVTSRRAQMEKETMADLKKGGVRVINRRGEVVDMAGKKAKAEGKLTGGGLKL